MLFPIENRYYSGLKLLGSQVPCLHESHLENLEALEIRNLQRCMANSSYHLENVILKAKWIQTVALCLNNSEIFFNSNYVGLFAKHFKELGDISATPCISTHLTKVMSQKCEVYCSFCFPSSFFFGDFFQCTF